MNVKQADKLSLEVKNLRENVYGKDDFKDIFAKELKDDIHAISTEFNADALGGWNVAVNVNRIKGKEDGIQDHVSDQYVEKISNALKSAIRKVDAHAVCDDTFNLNNIAITGPTSLVINI